MVQRSPDNLYTPELNGAIYIDGSTKMPFCFQTGCLTKDELTPNSPQSVMLIDIGSVQSTT